MKNKFINHTIFWICLLMIPLFFGCRDLTEDDLTGKNIAVIFPTDSLMTTNNDVTFVFDEIEDAIDYRLIIVNPGFGNIQNFILDSVLLESHFDINLNVGEYEWELVARNNSSESNKIRRKLFVEEASSLSEVYLQLTSPTTGYITNEDETVFRWDLVNGLNTYHLQFYQDNDGMLGSAVGPEYSTTTDSLLIQAPEGKLFWQMNVSDDTDQSPFVDRSIVVDRTAPSLPELLSPLDITYATSDTLVFSWNYGEDLLTATYDSLFVFDEGLTEEIYSLETTNSIESMLLADFALGNYYWRILTYDQAGNFSQSSDGLFTVE